MQAGRAAGCLNAPRFPGFTRPWGTLTQPEFRLVAEREIDYRRFALPRLGGSSEACISLRSTQSSSARLTALRYRNSSAETSVTAP
jgi:hypothetical protein